MKRSKIFSLLVLFSLLISACGGETGAQNISADDQVYTLAVQTLNAQKTAAPPTATVQDTATLFPTPANTLPSTPTLIPTATAGTYTQGDVYVQSSCDNSAYVADITIPDYTALNPGEEFVKTWSVNNTGTCTWTELYELTFTGGDSMSGYDTLIDQTVNSGENAEISVSLIAPETPGEYTGYWQLSNAAGVPFGDAIFVLIVVSDTTSTPTHTPDTTSTSTSTSATSTLTPTSTTAAANTSTPTATYTSVPASTSTATNTAVPTSTPTSTETTTP